MTQTVQSLALTAGGEITKIEAEETIHDILSVCNSLNKLCETLNRLEYAIKRRNMDAGLAQRVP